MQELLKEAGLREVSVQIELKQTLVKHLGPNEEICTDCGGSGMKVDDNIFGIRGVKSSNHPFPFKHESLRFCNGCYNGVRKRCEHCKELVPKGRTKCDCQWEVEAKKKADEKWAQIPKITLTEAIRQYGMLYVDDYDEYVNCDAFGEWIEYKQEESEEGTFNLKELRIFVTKEYSLQLDAAGIVEQASDDLHEDTEVPYKQMEELQAFLDEWCKKVEPYTKTYYTDTSIGVVCTDEEIDS